MLIFKPSDAMLLSMGGFASKHYCAGDWFMAYEWFCRKLIEFGGPFELMNETSSINNSEFNEIRSVNSARERIVYLLKHGWFQSEANKFIAFLGINTWEDLSKPITLKGRRPQAFPNPSWFKMRGRVFSYSPNDCHPEATWVQGFNIQFDDYHKRWFARIEYGYPHDGSSWTVGILQNYREHLNSFRKRVDVWIEEQLKPEGLNEPGQRFEQERTWERVNSAMKDIFWHGYLSPSILDHGKQMADLLVSVDGTSLTEGRMTITKARLATLKRWAQEQVDKNLD